MSGHNHYLYSMRDYQKINKKVAYLVAAILLLLFGFQALELGQRLWQGEATIKPFAHQTVKQQNNTPRLNLPKHLFGRVNSPVKRHKRIKKTRLNLTLVGVLNQKKHALAIIKRNNKEKIYKVNDKINSSAHIKAIYAKYVIIDHAGSDEKLSIKQKVNFGQANKGNKKSNNKYKQRISKKRGQQNKQANQKAVKKQPPPGGIIIIKPADKLKLQKILSSPKDMLSAIAIQPNYKNGELHGFAVRPGKEKTLFKKIGFQSGDVVLTINGITLDGWLKLVPARKEMSKQNFDLTIERKNQQHFLSINLGFL